MIRRTRKHRSYASALPRNRALRGFMSENCRTGTVIIIKVYTARYNFLRVLVNYADGYRRYRRLLLRFFYARQTRDAKK